MHAENQAPPTVHTRTITWIVLLTLVQAFVWFMHYGQTPLGESPALDNQQTLLLAQQMADGQLPIEPFHRAPLYPYLLSLFLSVGLPADALPLIARLLNAIALALIAGASARTASRIWKTPSAPWIAGLLIGLNPVLLFFSGDAFDILLAIAAFALALDQFIAWLPRPTWQRSLAIGLILALGAALRSHLLPLALLWPIAACILTPRFRLQHLAIAFIGPVLGFVLLGIANQRVAGEFRMLPWQGAYNLWAGNKPDANGRIYAQAIRVEFTDQYDNPAKLESLALYATQTGEVPPHDISTMNRHWKDKTFSYIQENRGQWIGLMFRKAYYFLNSYEQYDNKTYGFHKPQHLQLKINPIHWGALLILAVAGTLIGLRQPEHRKCLIALIIIFAAYAAGTILFYTSNRFRLPMLPVLAILSTGITLLPSTWRSATKRWKYSFALCLIATLTIAYSNFFDARNTNTWEEDFALLANASIRTGRDTDAIHWAQKALEMNPQRNDMQSTIVQAEFNTWALSPESSQPSREEIRELLEAAIQHNEDDSNLSAIAGIYHWKLGEQDAALQLWKSNSAESPFARLCLFWTGAMPAPTQAEMNLYESQKDTNLLLAAIQAKNANDNDPIKQTFNHMFLKASK
ncbi:MAG: hypothetical protein NWS71_00515 [Opitutales bacterium]|nr:hypothetical protein [Opitutales bacterium]MDP4776595.1 hypothetical protein [Opitutales bacterium]MDP5079016.1 hypothetical protein [Opitutales bacterium]